MSRYVHFMSQLQLQLCLIINKPLMCLNTYHLNTRFSHSDIAATQSTAIPVRLLIKYVSGKTSKKAAFGSPIWVMISHSFWWSIVLCCRLSANQTPWVYTASILLSAVSCDRPTVEEPTTRNLCWTSEMLRVFEEYFLMSARWRDSAANRRRLEKTKTQICSYL